MSVGGMADLRHTAWQQATYNRSMQSIYLDHNSTTPILPQVASAMVQCEARAFANPASQHAAGRRARQMLEDTRQRIAELLGVRTDDLQADRVILTSGGT